MTTSPFGAPNQFGTAAPASAEPAPATPPAGSSRKPLLYVLGGVAAVAAVGAGAFFLLAPGESDEPAAAPVPRGSGTANEPETDPEAVVEEPVLVTQSSRNPFAALVLPGGAGATATAPEASGSGSAGSTSGGSASGGSAAPAVEGTPGADGADGRNGKDGKNGKNGADGLTPMFVTIQVVDIDEATNTVDAVVRTSLGETTPIDLPIGSAFDPNADSPASVIVYTSVGTDISSPTDDEVDFVTVTVDGVDYTAHVGETFLTFVYQ